MEVLKIVIYSVLLLGGLALFFAGLISFLAKKLHVDQDPRIDAVRGLLSGANCGACGEAGCDAFAKSLVEGKNGLSACPSTSAENKEKIGEILGISADGEETEVRVICCGGNNCKDKYSYQGYGDCKSMELLAEGRKLCPVGCMGMGSCVDACHYDAIEVNDEGFAEVNQENCIGCGACIDACPKDLIQRVPKKAKILISCSNHGKGKEVKSICATGCIGCTLCVKACKYDAIKMENNLPVIDYNKCVGCLECVAKCPTKVIRQIK